MFLLFCKSRQVFFIHSKGLRSFILVSSSLANARFPPKWGLSSTNRIFFPVFTAFFAADNPAGPEPTIRTSQ